MEAKVCVWESSSARAAASVIIPIHTADIWQAWKWFMKLVVERRVCWSGFGSHWFQKWKVTVTLNEQLHKCLRFCPVNPIPAGVEHAEPWDLHFQTDGCCLQGVEICAHISDLCSVWQLREERKAKNERVSAALELPVLRGLQAAGANVSGANSAWRYTTLAAGAQPHGVVLHVCVILMAMFKHPFPAQPSESLQAIEQVHWKNTAYYTVEGDCKPAQCSRNGCTVKGKWVATALCFTIHQHSCHNSPPVAPSLPWSHRTVS